jgi:hypothetical protein
MKRRTFCTLGGLTLVGLAGCLSSSGANGDGNGEDERAGDDKSGGDSGNGSNSATGTDTDSGWGQTETEAKPETPHHLFVENHTDETESAWIQVTRENDSVLVDGRYELPDGRAIEFADIAAWETTYTVEISLDREDPTTLEWRTTECGPDSEAPDGSRNAAVRYGADDIEDGHQFDLVVDMCDAIVAGRLPSGPAEQFRMDA